MNVNNGTIKEIISFIDNNGNVLTWQEIADEMNSRYNLDFSESWYRKHYNYDWCPEKFSTDYDEDVQEDSESEELPAFTDIQIERKKLTDQITQNNAILRKIYLDILLNK